MKAGRNRCNFVVYLLLERTRKFVNKNNVFFGQGQDISSFIFVFLKFRAKKKRKLFIEKFDEKISLI